MHTLQNKLLMKLDPPINWDKHKQHPYTFFCEIGPAHSQAHAFGEIGPACQQTQARSQTQTFGETGPARSQTKASSQTQARSQTQTFGEIGSARLQAFNLAFNSTSAHAFFSFVPPMNWDKHSVCIDG